MPCINPIVLLSGGEPPQADYSAKKAILQYCPVTSQIIMGRASHAPTICQPVVATKTARRLAAVRYYLTRLLLIISKTGLSGTI